MYIAKRRDLHNWAAFIAGPWFLSRARQLRPELLDGGHTAGFLDWSEHPRNGFLLGAIRGITRLRIAFAGQFAEDLLRMWSSRAFLSLILISWLLPRCIWGESPAQKLRGRTYRNSAVECAQSVARHSKRKFDAISRDIDIGNLPEAVALLNKYHDKIQSCDQALESKKLDAANYPETYKQLEISLRRSLRRLNELITSLATDDQAPFLEVKDELEQLDRVLIQELFPD